LTAPKFLRTRLISHGDLPALAWRGSVLSYREFAELIDVVKSEISSSGIGAGDVVSLVADYSPRGIASLIALAELGCISVPMARPLPRRLAESESVAHATGRVTIDERDQTTIAHIDQAESHPLLDRLRAERHAGLVLFSSGTTGASKGTVHDLERLLSKFRRPGRAMRTLAFYVFDHIGGLDVLFGTLHAGGCLVIPEDRTPEAVLGAVESHGVELLPVTPTFLHLMLLSEAHKRYRLETVQVVAYGAEPMPESTRLRLQAEWPSARLVQTYGLSELGTLRARPREPGSPWLELSGEGQTYRVVDGILQIRSETSMLGYLNAPSPSTEDGWFITGDQVEVDGSSLRILGRKVETINVGGEKVFPQEVESVLLEFPGVIEAAVYGERNPITGNMVCARLRASVDVPEKEFVGRLKAFCRERLEPYKVPVRIRLDQTEQHGQRWKKERNRVAQSAQPGLIEENGPTTSTSESIGSTNQLR
jgi:long-chain acyl-CoA synthetase